MSEIEDENLFIEEEIKEPTAFENLMSYFWIFAEILIFMYNSFAIVHNVRIGDGYLYITIGLIINICIFTTYGNLFKSKFPKASIFIPYIILGIVGLLGIGFGSGSGGKNLRVIIMIIIFFPVYCIPSIIALYRNHQYKWIIVMINIFTGWLGIGSYETDLAINNLI